MKIEIQPRDDHQVNVIAEFESDLFEVYKARAARKISKDAKIPGFRPGKAPLPIIRRFYGEETIIREALDLLLEEKYADVVKEAGIEPYGPGSLDNILQNDPPKFSFLIPLAPVVTLGDYKSIQKSYDLPAITEDRIEVVIRNLRASYSTAEPVQRPIQEGDLVSVNFLGENTAPAEGETEPAFKQEAVQMIVGVNEFEEDDWPFVGFTRELVGLSEGEEKTVVHVYPADDKEDRLAGKEIKITFTPTSVKALTLPEVTDEFAQSVGEYENVAALRKSIQQTLEDNDHRDYDNKFLTEVVDEIRSLSTIKFPPQALEEEAAGVVHSIEHNLEDQKMDLDTYLKTIHMEKPEWMEKEVNPIAKQRLERSLVLDEVARVEALKLDLDALQKEADATMRALEADPEFQKSSKGRSKESVARSVTMEAANRVMNRQVLSHLKALVTGQAESPVELVGEAEEVSVSEPAEVASPEQTEVAEQPAAEQVSTPAPEEKKPAAEETAE